MKTEMFVSGVHLIIISEEFFYGYSLLHAVETYLNFTLVLSLTRIQTIYYKRRNNRLVCLIVK